MTPEVFKRWRTKRAGLTQQQAADLLGITRRTLNNWEAGDSAIPHMTELACRYLNDVFSVMVLDRPAIEGLTIAQAMQILASDGMRQAKILDRRGDLVWPPLSRYRVVVDGKYAHLGTETAKEALTLARRLR